MDLTRVKNLLGKRGVQVVSQESSDRKDNLRTITPYHLGEGFVSPSRQTVNKYPTSLLKRYIVILTVVLAALCSGYLLNAKLFAYGAIALVIFTALFVVQTLLLRRNTDIVLASVLDACALLLFLAGIAIQAALYSLAVLITIFVLAHLSSKRFANNMVQIKFFRAVRPGTGLLLIALSIFASYILFTNSGTLLKQENIARLVDTIAKPILSSKVADFSAEMPFGNFLHNFVRNELSQDKDFRNLSEFDKERVIALQVVDLASLIEARTGYKPQLDQSVTENLQELVAAKTSTFYPESRAIRLILLMVVVIFVVKSLGFLLFPLFALLAFIVYELLLSSGFVEVQFESRSKEILHLPSRRS